MNSIESLIGILEEEVRGYSELLSLLRKEKEAILSFRPGEIEEMAKEKDALVLKLRLLDDERKRLLREQVAEEGLEPDLMTLYQRTGDGRLPELRSRLKSLLIGIQELNELNRILIDRATLHVRTSASFLQSFGITGGQGQSLSCQV
jgi:flagellar biosynthesis/type III secretory pathway chaperone